jgi:hypothetical protein
MNRFEKMAWFNLAVVTVSILLFLTLFFIFRTTRPFTISIKASCSAFALLSLTTPNGIGMLFFKRKDSKDSGYLYALYTNIYGSDVDERDRLIWRRALLHGFQVLWFFYVVFGMCLWSYFRFIRMSTTIDVDILVFTIIPAASILIFAYSLSVILQYRISSIGENIYEIGNGPRRKTVFSIFAFFFFFIGFSIFLLRILHSDWMFAVMFVMMFFGSTQFFIQIMRKNRSSNFTKGDIFILEIAEWIMRSLFIIFYILSIYAIIVTHSEYRNTLITITRSSVFIFITWSFYPSIRDAVKDILSRRHNEKS